MTQKTNESEKNNQRRSNGCMCIYLTNAIEKKKGNRMGSFSGGSWGL